MLTLLYYLTTYLSYYLFFVVLLCLLITLASAGFSNMLFSLKVLCPIMDCNSQLCHHDVAISSNLRGPFVYGFIDLFSGSGESWNWGFGMDENAMDSLSFGPSKLRLDAEEEKSKRHMKPQTLQNELLHPVAKLGTLEEESEEENKSMSSTNTSTFSMEKLVLNSNKVDKEVNNILMAAF